LMCPAVGQGALAVEAREGSEATEVCARLDDARTRAAVEAERAVLESLGGGCQVPIGAYGRLSDGQLHLLGVVASPDGRRVVRRETSGPASDAVRLGHELGGELLAGGGREILEEVYGS
jgi:hydroxymethylbilane synthase